MTARFFASACLILVPAGAIAQSDEGNSADVAGVLDLITDPEEMAADISQQLSACMRPLFDDELAHDPVAFSVTFDQEGAPEAPLLVEPELGGATRSEMRQLFRAEAAIFDCSPVTVGGAPVIDTTLTLKASGDLIEIWEPVESVPSTPVDLSRSERREVQIRLGLIGQDPGGADGIFGPRTEEAISGWQAESGFPATGTLDAEQLEELVAETQAAYEEWQAEQARTPQRTSRYYRGSDGCLRYANRRIVPGQSLKCDAKGLIEGF